MAHTFIYHWATSSQLIFTVSTSSTQHSDPSLARDTSIDKRDKTPNTTFRKIMPAGWHKSDMTIRKSIKFCAIGYLQVPRAPDIAEMTACEVREWVLKGNA